MVWSPRPHGELSDTVKQMTTTITAHAKKLVILGRKRDVVEILATALGLPIGQCRLPGCGEVFLKVPENKEFCVTEHKTEFNNKHCR